MTQPAERPLLVHVCPLPPQRNGIADYAAAILERLAARYELICVVAAPEIVDPFFHDIAEVISFDDYHRIAGRLAGERHLSHIGNNDDHVPILDVLSQVPGVVVLHDLTLHYMMGRWAQTRFGEDRALVDVVRLLHGGRAADLAAAKLERRRVLQSIYSEVNCLPFFRDTARAMITHSQYGRVLLDVAGVEAPVTVIPHFAQVPDALRHSRSRTAWRRRLRAGPDTVVFVSLGFVIPNKQIPMVLEALAALPGDWLYVIGGEDRDPAVRATCRRLGIEHRVVFLDYLDEADFDAVLAAGDVLINLRFPTSGETSGTVCRALANGLPCLVTDHGWYAELPETVTYRIPPGPGAAAELDAVLRIALYDPQIRAEKAAAARDYALTHLALDRVVEDYVAVIEAAQARPDIAVADIAAGQGGMRSPLILPLAITSEALAGMAPAAIPLAALRAECAAQACPMVLPGAFDLAELAAAPAAGAPVQALAALWVEDMALGGILGVLEDMRRQLRPGDLLSLCLMSRQPDRSPLAGARVPLIRHLPQDQGLADVLCGLLADAGFSLLRIAENPVIPSGVSDEYLRIIVATAQFATANIQDEIMYCAQV